MSNFGLLRTIYKNRLIKILFIVRINFMDCHSFQNSENSLFNRRIYCKGFEVGFRKVNFEYCVKTGFESSKQEL